MRWRLTCRCGAAAAAGTPIHSLTSCPLCAPPTPTPAALAKLFRGHVSELLRHPYGADVMVDLYDVCPPPLRNTLAAEMYGREFSLFDGVATPGSEVTHLRSLLDASAPTKRVNILQHLTRQLAPVLEKALLHPPIVHRCAGAVRTLSGAAP